jgi:hypothetical protein
MSSESVCQVARNWMKVGSFQTRLLGVLYFSIVSVREILDNPRIIKHSTSSKRGFSKIYFNIILPLNFGLTVCQLVTTYSQLTIC